AYGPYAHNSFRARSWWYRAGGRGYYSVYRAPRYVYVKDPYVAPWGPYWAYDPWGSYWDGYRDGYFDGRWTRAYTPRPVRTVYVRGGRPASTVVRPSPLAWRSTSFKENPVSPVTRTAVRRGDVGGAAPSGTRIAQDR